MARAHNFSPGPATLPEPVLRQAAAEMLDWQGSGVGVMEMSHRGREFAQIFERTEARLRELLAVPAHFRVLFMQGGAIGENAVVPMNLIARRPARRADHVITGTWSKKTSREGERYGQVHVAASNEATRHTTLPAPSSWQLSADASYVHLCSNETIGGVEVHELPDLRALGSEAPLVIDASSHLASRPIAWDRVGLVYAGAQKNIGPAGLTLVFVRDDLLGHALPVCPSAFDYATVASNGSMFNTPPTWAIYIAGLVFEWIAQQGGIAAIEQRNVEKAALLYAAIDGSEGFYVNRVAHDCRSRMNVPFFLREDSLTPAFLDAARERGLLQLKGHKSVGGLRASLYNAMPLAGVQSLVGCMQEFAAHHG
ncbi:MAG TPA: 3-phosphoserine/phosphohydroxythreonine transaminase [Methylibium sp.]|uniref:3-phosphoserine/phosphohydroxythreonine transaminase n=1 Tax=Methylibium sp. TaxID=2067992 RepID=UPI002DB81419|nr:3-phosphoserine/phosphohydroxythreonine transaminase [Methylibium sp.]HEU4457652.1 3-phosphoserine/phosphohydroxythreonine transaminase [Methylibium sp.]